MKSVPQRGPLPLMAGTDASRASSRRADVPTPVLLLLCGATSVGYYVSVTGAGTWWLGLVAFAPLVVALRSMTRWWHVALAGWLTLGLALLLACSWLAPTVTRFSAGSTSLGVVVLVLYAAVEGARLGLAALIWWLIRPTVAVSPVVFGLSAIALDSLWPRLFPWPMGMGLFSSDLLIQLTELGGVSVLTFVMASSGCALGEWVSARWRPSPQGSAAGLEPSLYGYAAALAVCFAWGFWCLNLRGYPHDETLRVGVVQGGALVPRRPRPSDEVLPIHVAMTSDLLRSQNVDLVVWGETVVAQPLDERTWRRDLSRRIKRPFSAPLLLGANVVASEDDRVTSLQNSALLLMPNGGSCGACKYDKQQLVPVGERLPPRVELQSIFPKAGRYQAGRSGGALRLAEHWLAVFICYEALDGARVSELVESKDAGLLVNLTSDAWFGRSIEPLQHLLLARLRAVEQRRYMVRAADTGISAIIDPRGRIIQSISLHETRAFVETVHLRHARTLYSRWGDRPWLALSALLALFLVKRGVDRVLRQVRGAPASP